MSVEFEVERNLMDSWEIKSATVTVNGMTFELNERGIAQANLAFDSRYAAKLLLIKTFRNHYKAIRLANRVDRVRKI